MRRKRSKTHSPRRDPYGRLGAPVGRPVGFGVRFRIALAGRALRIHAPGPGVGFAFGVDFEDPLGYNAFGPFDSAVSSSFAWISFGFAWVVRRCYLAVLRFCLDIIRFCLGIIRFCWMLLILLDVLRFG